MRSFRGIGGLGQESEGGEVVELSAALFREDAGRRDASVNLDWPAEEGWEHFAGFVASEDGLCLVAGSGEEIAGYMAGYVKEGSTLRPVKVAELESMYVREEYRGQGMGAKLVGEFFRWAGELGASIGHGIRGERRRASFLSQRGVRGEERLSRNGTMRISRLPAGESSRTRWLARKRGQAGARLSHRASGPRFGLPPAALLP